MFQERNPNNDNLMNGMMNKYSAPEVLFYLA
jgi:hypothetical protein